MQKGGQSKKSIMTMASQWKNEYEILKNYITSNPEISIGVYETSIPEEYKDKFYLLFDNIRKAFVESWGSSSDLDFSTLGKNFIETEKILAESLNLKNMDLPVDLASFLQNPETGMMRLIYDRLFELVQGKITEDDFEKTALDKLGPNTAEFYRLGYEQWTAVSILQLLEPDEILGVSIDDDYNLHLSKLDQITFGKQDHHASKRIPEFIIHSKKLDKYIAFKMPLATSVNFYSLPPELPTKRLLRDRTGDTSQVLGPRMLFLAVVPDLEKIPVFADLHGRTINGPDITIEFLMGYHLSDTEAVRQIQNHVEIMRPRLGGNIVLVDHNSDSVSDKTKNGIDIFSVELDQSGLQPIIDKLAN